MKISPAFGLKQQMKFLPADKTSKWWGETEKDRDLQTEGIKVRK